MHKANVVLTTCPSTSTIQVVPSPHSSLYSNKHRGIRLHCCELRKNVCHLSLMHCAYGAIKSTDLALSHKPIPYTFLVFNYGIEIWNAVFRELLCSQDFWHFHVKFTFMLPCIVMDFFLNNQPDALIIQIYSVIKLYMFRASSLPIIRSFLLHIRHW